MKYFVKACSIIKYFGLLGLASLFIDVNFLKLFWLLWFFGIVEIVYDIPLYSQALQQLWGLVVIPIKYGSNIPNKDNYSSDIKYSLPFEGEWTTINGGLEKEFSHSWEIPTQRYAYDFICLNHEGKSYLGDANVSDSYFCYGKDILAPADGEIVEIGDKQPDVFLVKQGKLDSKTSDIRGNYILIKHSQNEYSLLAHLQQNSIVVKIGDTVKRGQPIAKCGNTGNSSEPHLHFQIQDGRSFVYSAGIPIEFDTISVKETHQYKEYDTRTVSKIVPNRISRGQTVSNI